MHRREHEQVQKLRGAPRNRAHKVTRVGTPTRPGTHLTAGHTDMHTYTHRLRYTHTRSQSSQVHIHVYGNARHRNTHSSATESHCLQLRPTSEFPRRLYPRDPISIWPRHLKVPPHLAIPTRSQPQAQPGFTVKFRSTPSPALPSVTHHPKPPKETLRFLPNIVVAGGHLVQRRPRSCWQDCRSLGAAGSTASHEGRGTHCGTSPIACPPTRLPVGEAMGWEVCPGPQDAPRQAGEVAEGSFPSPRGTRSSGRGSAGRLHHSPSWQLCPTPPGLPGSHGG